MQTNQFGDPRLLVAVIFSLALIITVWMWHDIEKQKFNAGENRFQIHSTTERQLPVVLILDTHALAKFDATTATFLRAAGPLSLRVFSR